LALLNDQEIVSRKGESKIVVPVVRSFIFQTQQIEKKRAEQISAKSGLFDLFFNKNDESNLSVFDYCQWRNRHGAGSIDPEIVNYIFQCFNQEPPGVLQSAKGLLKSYFLAIRKIHRDTPLSIFQTLIRLTMSHAALCALPAGNLSSALIAIELVEESLLDQDIGSIFAWRKNSRNLLSYGRTIEECYSGFHKHVLQFCELSGCMVDEGTEE